jgi:hypothetical protein
VSTYCFNRALVVCETASLASISWAAT